MLRLNDIEDAFFFVSSASYGMHSAVLSKKTGQPRSCLQLFPSDRNLFRFSSHRGQTSRPCLHRAVASEGETDLRGLPPSSMPQEHACVPNPFRRLVVIAHQPQHEPYRATLKAEMVLHFDRHSCIATTILGVLAANCFLMWKFWRPAQRKKISAKGDPQ